jgi:hypothetical protein
MSKPTNPPDKLPLDDIFYSLTPQEALFFKSHTGIEDDDDLKRHILAVQKKAYDVRSLYYAYKDIDVYSLYCGRFVAILAFACWPSQSMSSSFPSRVQDHDMASTHL